MDVVAAMEVAFFEASTNDTAAPVILALLESVVAATGIKDNAVEDAEIADVEFAAKVDVVSGGWATGAWKGDPLGGDLK